MLLLKLKKRIPMLHYCKMILEKMSIDQALFRKELRKAYQRLSPNEAYELYQWGSKRFPELMIGVPQAYIRA